MKHEKKVLIIAYYWPPSGGSGVQRWLKFVKYLPSFGWTPYVVTPENPSFEIKDESLVKDISAQASVIKLPIWEPYHAFNKLTSLLKSSKQPTRKPVQLVKDGEQSFVMRLGAWVRGNFFIPDPKIFWIKPTVNFLQEFLKKENIETIITTGPPHSMHLIGLKLKQNNPLLKWVVDFRDPWSEWGLLDTLRVNDRVRARHRQLELEVLQKADRVITVTSYFTRRFADLGGRKVDLISNGFDEDDFKNIVSRKTDKFMIRHAGIVNERSNPIPFMNAVSALCQEHPEIAKELQVEFVGDVHSSFISFVNDDKVLQSVTKFTASIPHSKLLDLYSETSALLLIITEYKGSAGYTGGKSFEYIATGLPIIAIGPPEGEAARLLQETSAGEVFASKDLDKIKNALLLLFRQWKSGNAVRRPVSDLYSRKRLTQQLSELLNSLTDKI